MPVQTHSFHHSMSHTTCRPLSQHLPRQQHSHVCLCCTALHCSTLLCNLGGRAVLQLLQCGAGRPGSLWVPPPEGDHALGRPLSAGQPGLVRLLQLRLWLVLLRPSA